MKFIQYYLDCLSQASYLIGDDRTGRAVVVDPRRDVSQYLADAAEAGLSIELIIETHFHADFLSGHLELAAATGATIAYSSVATTEFESRKLDHGERIELGDVVLEIRHTPGHTPESISIVVWDNPANVEPHAVLTGDTLFIGDVGRPDLLSAVGFTQEELAADLYDSLHNQLLTLPDSTRVYPGHGAGSACGKNLSSETSSTIGEQRASNYALLAPDEAAFIELVTEGQQPAPGYFAYDAMLNRQNHPLLDESAPPPMLDVTAFDDAAFDNAVGDALVVDCRPPDEFARGHLVGSINVGLNGRFAEFAGSVIPVDSDLVLVVNAGDEVEARNRLARIGFDRVVGVINNLTSLPADQTDRIQIPLRLTPTQLAEMEATPDEVQLVDVRNAGELEHGVIPDAITIPLVQLRNRLNELDPSIPTVVYCAGGYRSSVGASVLRHAGFLLVSDIIGGYQAWQDTQVLAS